MKMMIRMSLYTEQNGVENMKVNLDANGLNDDD